MARELLLVSEQLRRAGDTGALPVRFVELVTAMTHRHSTFTVEQDVQRRAAVAARPATVDLRYSAPASSGPAAAGSGPAAGSA